MGILGSLFGSKDYNSMSDDELSEHREKVRQRYLKHGREKDEDALYDIDTVMIDRMNAEYEREHPDAKPRHREHGWYLPNDD